jgi:photoactive yellow protein
MDFEDPRLLASLDAAHAETLDAAPFGIVGMNSNAIVVSYNAFESRFSGLTPEHVFGRNFFIDVAPCSNNFMVAQRFEDEARLDETIPYVFTFKMSPRRVRLRLLKAPEALRQYLLIQPLS